MQPSMLVTMALLAAMLAGCASMLTTDAPQEMVYWLEPPNPISPATGTMDRTRIQVRIAAAPGLDTDRLLIRGPGAVLNYYAGARWADNTPELLDSLTRAALQDSRRFSRVTSSRSGTTAEWLLDLELRAFYAVVSADTLPPTIEIELRGYLQCEQQNVLIRIEDRAPAAQNTLTGIVSGFQAVVDSGLRELLTQIPDTCPRQ